MRDAGRQVSIKPGAASEALISSHLILIVRSVKQNCSCYSKMSSKKKGALSNPQLKDKQVDLTKASTVIQTYVQIILQQQDLKLTALPDLPKHQQTARSHANNWQDTILPLMAKTDADIIDYANKFNAFYEDLVKLSKDLNNADSRKKFVEGLKLLQNTIKRKDANVAQVLKDLSSFHTNLNTDNQHFQSDVNTAAVKIEGDSGEIKSLSDQLDAINNAMHKDIGLMAGGAVTIVAGVGMIVFGAISEIPSGGMSTALIGGGVLVVSAGTVMETFGSTDYSAQIEKQKKASEKLKGIKIELAGLKTTKGQLEGFVKGLQSAITAATSLQAAWGALDNNLQELITALKDVNPDDGTWVKDELDRAKKDWADALDQAKKLQPDGKVPTKFYTNLQDAFKEMKPRGKA